MEETKRAGICREFILIMQASLDGAAPVEEEKALESHLEHCGDCRKLYHELKQIREAVSCVAAEPPSDLGERVMARLQEENRRLSVEKVRKSKNRKRITGFVLGAAALLALAFVGVEKLGLLSMQGRTADSAVKESLVETSHAYEYDAVAMPEADSAVEYRNESDAEESGTKGIAYPAKDGESESETDLNRWDIAQGVMRIVKEAGIKGLYGEVVFAHVEKHPDAVPLATSQDGACAFYAIDDFAEFITSQKVVLSDIQYELTEEEIRGCGLSCGGSRILLILDKGMP
ncbi:MAG: zf-HC2 domain-containing protein [Clostridia bacterium]|nr:zf-HC2 domain-containing protein [Clostridia bacterium]